MERKRLLWIINALGTGGAERVMSVFLSNKRLSEKFDMHVALLEDRQAYPIPSNVGKHKLSHFDSTTPRWKKAMYIPRWYLSLKELKKQLNPHYSLSFLTLSNFLNVITRTGNEKVVVSERNNPLRNYCGNIFMKGFYRKVVSFLYPRADGIIAVSKGAGEILSGYARIDPSLIRVLNNPCDLKMAGEKAQEKIDGDILQRLGCAPFLLSVGRLIPQKGFDVLLRAFSRIRSIFPRHKILILGDGPLRDNLLELAGSLGVSENLILAGKRENPFKYMKNADIFVLPSLWEGFPNVLTEAMACGCPVVASNCDCGPEEILENEKFGYLFPPGDVTALAEKILMLEPLQERERLGRLSKERAGHFHVDIMAEKLIEILESV